MKGVGLYPNVPITLVETWVLVSEAIFASPKSATWAKEFDFVISVITIITKQSHLMRKMTEVFHCQGRAKANSNKQNQTGIYSGRP
jgi:hypothetical protein